MIETTNDSSIIHVEGTFRMIDDIFFKGYILSLSRWIVSVQLLFLEEVNPSLIDPLLCWDDMIRVDVSLNESF